MPLIKPTPTYVMIPEITRHLWEALWFEYSSRVSYARTYQEMITENGGTIVNDHIAFRSLRMTVDAPQGKVNLGIDYLGKLAEALGYEAAGEYSFPQTHLYARHYCHPQQEEFDLPKLFISELIVDELPLEIVELIHQTVAGENLLSFLAIIDTFADQTKHLVQQLQKIFTRPWQPPRYSVLQEVNQVTQYGAWVLLHGYTVNHFTGYVNRQNTPKYPDIDTTASGLAKLGVPMKAEIEGDITCGLRQTATQAVTEVATVLNDITNTPIQIPWKYAYYEIAQRYMVDVDASQQVLFDGFLGRNAQQLFEMTRVKSVGAV